MTLALAGLFLLLCAINAQDAEFKPDFGATLNRSATTAVIDLVDAKGKPLVVAAHETVSLFCWRHVGRFHRSADARFEREQSRIVADGNGGRGLEPGKYTLESSIAGYGALRVEFEVKVGSPVTRKVTLPHWRRVITFRVVDEDDKPIEALPIIPEYTYSWQQVTGFDNRNMVGVLRAPPGQSRGGAGGIGGRGRRATRRETIRFATDEGRVHLAVYAGHKGVARLTYQHPSVEFADTFDGDDWKDERVIKVTRNVELDAKMGGLKPTTSGLGPGNKALLEPPRNTRDTLPEKGIFIDLLGDKRLYPELEDKRRVWRDKETGIWFAEFDEAEQVEVPRMRLTDGRFYREPWRTIPEAMKDGKLKTWRAVEARELVIRIKGSTHRAWASWLRADLPSEYLENDEGYPDWPFDGSAFTLLISPEQMDSLRSERALKVAIGGGYELEHRPGAVLYRNNEKPRDMGDVWLRWGSQQAREVLEVPLSDAVLDALAKGKSEVEVGLGGLAFRAVAAGKGGLPHVGAALHPLEEDAVAQRLRAKEEELGDKRPNIVFLKRELADKLAAADKNTSDDDLREWLGEAVFDALGERDLRLRFGKFGSWYDTRAPLESDEHGYVVGPTRSLEAGRKYVLYLWSRSRNDLKPDKRVVFTAGKGMTDLGAIELPWFEE